MNPEGNFAKFYKNEKDFFLWIIKLEEGPFEFRIAIPSDLLEENIETFINDILNKKKIKASVREEVSRRFEGKEAVIVKIEDKDQAFEFF